MKQQTIMCFSAQTHAGWMGTGKHLETYIFAKKESMGLKILTRLKYSNRAVT